jgi:hypothetical protein
MPPYRGDGINGVIGALQRAGHIEFVQVQHEEMAAFMAVAHAKFTGDLGVCLSTARLSRAPHLVPPHGHRVDPREHIIRRQRLVGRNGRLAVLAELRR